MDSAAAINTDKKLPTYRIAKTTVCRYKSVRAPVRSPPLAALSIFTISRRNENFEPALYNLCGTCVSIVYQIPCYNFTSSVRSTIREFVRNNFVQRLENQRYANVFNVLPAFTYTSRIVFLNGSLFQLHYPLPSDLAHIFFYLEWSTCSSIWISHKFSLCICLVFTSVVVT